MPDHRKTPVSSALTLPLWAIVASMVLCLGAAGYLGYLVVDERSDDASAGSAPATSGAPTAAPTTATATPAPTPAPTTVPTATDSPTPTPVARDSAVGVFNQSGVRGGAATAADLIRAKGWNVTAVGNWRGTVPSTTIYYPDDLETDARQLALDVGIERVMPRVSTMRTDRLTVVLVTPL